MYLEIHEFEYRICKGRLQSYVARAKEPPDRIVKSIRTFISNAGIDRDVVKRMLNEVQRDSVFLFLGPPWNQSKTQERFQLIRAALLRE